MTLPTETEIYQQMGLALKADDVPTDVIKEPNITQYISYAKKWFHGMRGYQLEETTVKEKLWGNNSDYIHCLYYPFPVQGDAESDDTYYARVVTSITIDGDAVTVNSTNLDLDVDLGKIILKSDGSPEVTGFTKSRNYPTVKITHLYQDTTEDYFELAIALRATILASSAHIGSTYDDVTSWSKADLSAAKGEPYTNIRAAAFEFRQILDKLMAQISHKVIIG